MRVKVWIFCAFALSAHAVEASSFLDRTEEICIGLLVEEVPPSRLTLEPLTAEQLDGLAMEIQTGDHVTDEKTRSAIQETFLWDTIGTRFIYFEKNDFCSSFNQSGSDEQSRSETKTWLENSAREMLVVSTLNEDRYAQVTSCASVLGGRVLQRSTFAGDEQPHQDVTRLTYVLKDACKGVERKMLPEIE